MYGEPDKAEKAKEHKHMTFKEAAGIARKAAPTQMWLTHYSPAMADPAAWLPRAQVLFPGAEAGYDGMAEELEFENDSGE